MFRSVLLVLALIAAVPPAAAQREQDNAYRLAKEGHIMQLGDILAAVSPHVAGKFIGSEFDAAQIFEIIQLVAFYHGVSLICGALDIPPEAAMGCFPDPKGDARLPNKDHDHA